MMFCAQIAHMVKLQADELMSRGFKEQTKQKTSKKSGFKMFQVHLSTMDVTSVLEFIEYR